MATAKATAMRQAAILAEILERLARIEALLQAEKPAKPIAKSSK